ncbi:NPC intracellular cholesterol transporter 1-like isoform X2 [Oculina patagonica]
MELSSIPEARQNNSACKGPRELSNFITSSLEKGFYRLGKAVGGSPWITILISLVVSGGCIIGALKFTQENRADKLWTPEDSIAQRHKEWVQENFPAEVRVSTVLLVAKNVLTPETMKTALMVHRRVTQIAQETELSWGNVCFRIGTICFACGLLELWSFDEAVINRLTKEDILQKLNQKVIVSPMTRKKFVLSKYLGGIVRNSTGHKVGAEATTLLYGVRFNAKLNPSEGRLILPALRSFCIFAAIGILADFILQATLFTALLAIDARRQESRRDGCCCCCMKLPDDYSEGSFGKRDLLKEFMDKYIGPMMLSLPGKVTVIIITGAMFGVNLYGTLQLEQYFDQNWVLPPDSMTYKYTHANSKYFPVHGSPVDIYTGKFDYFKEQDKLHKLHDIAVSDEEYIVSSSVNSWYEEFIDWAIDEKPEQYIKQRKITNETWFYLWLSEFLQTSGMSYQRNIRIENGTGHHPFQITATRMNLRHKSINSTRKEVKAMEKLRDRVGSVFPNDSQAFPFSPFYLSFETNKVISKELFRNMGLALLTVMLVTPVALTNLRTCFLVFTCVGLTLVNIMGTMHFWGLTIDIVTTMFLVLAVGLSVDYASHIGHMFMTIPGSRLERALVTLRDIGPAVWNGGFSTFLAVVLLVFSKSYVSMTFFKVFFCVVFYGLFHGLFYLPVILSFIGPSPYESSRVHLEQTVSPSQSDHRADCPDTDDDHQLNNNRVTPSEPFHSSKIHPEQMVLPSQPHHLDPNEDSHLSKNSIGPSILDKRNHGRNFLLPIEELDITTLEAGGKVNEGFCSPTDLDKT